jgi:hypothetical protein
MADQSGVISLGDLIGAQQQCLGDRDLHHRGGLLAYDQLEIGRLR